MKHLFAIFFLPMFGIGETHAGDPRPCDKPPCPPIAAPCPPPPIVWEEKVITMYRPELKPHDVKETVDQLYLNPVLHKETILVPELVPVPQTKKVCIPKLVPRQVVQEVCCTKIVTETVTDPCTGCLKTICKTVPAVKQVVRTVYDIEMLEQEVPITKYCLKTEEKPIDVRQFVGEIKPMDLIRRSYSLELVPFQVKVKVPVCPEGPLPCK
jgi:hypothetical protein